MIRIRGLLETHIFCTARFLYTYTIQHDFFHMKAILFVKVLVAYTCTSIFCRRRVHALFRGSHDWHVHITSSPHAMLVIHFQSFYEPCVPKKGCHQTHGGNFVKFQPIFNFFHFQKGVEISNKSTYYFLPHLKYVAPLPVGIQKFKYVV